MLTDSVSSRQLSLPLEDCRHPVYVLCPGFDDRPDEQLINAFASRVTGFANDVHVPVNEIRGFLRVEGHVARAIARAVNGAPSSFWTSSGEGDGKTDGRAVADRLRDLMRAEELDLPETSLETENPSLMEPVDEEVVGRIERFAMPLVAMAGALDMVLRRWTFLGGGDMTCCAHWEAIDDLAVAVKTFEEFVWQDLFTAMPDYLAGVLCPDHAIGLRRSVLKLLSSAANRAEAYALDWRCTKEEIDRIAVPVAQWSVAEAEAIAKFRTEHDEGCKRSRKRKARVFARHFDFHLHVAVARTEESEAFFEAKEKAAAKMMERGLDLFEFAYETRPLDEQGIPFAKIASHRARVWRRKVFEADIGVGAADLLPSTDDELIVEFVDSEFVLPDDTEASSPARRCPWPTFARHARDGVLLPPMPIPEQFSQARFVAICEDAMPFPDSAPAGLCNPDPTLRGLAAAAMVHGRTVVDVEPYLHGQLFAAATVVGIGMSFCRSGELRQTVHDAAGWTEVSDGRRNAAAFYAVPKGGGDRQEFVMSPLAMDLLGRLVAFTLRRGGLDEISVVDPSADLAARVGPGRFVFAYADRMLGVRDLNHLLAVLFAGVSPVRTHDIRHAAAMRARREKHSHASISTWMRTSGACTPHYCEDPYDEPFAMPEGDDPHLEQLLDFLDRRADYACLAAF